MDLKKRAQSRISIWVDEGNKRLNEPLHSHMTKLKDFRDRDDSILQENIDHLERAGRSHQSFVTGSGIGRKSIFALAAAAAARSAPCKQFSPDLFDPKVLLHLIIQEAVDHLALIVGRQCPHKAKMYLYKTPAERFCRKTEYTLEETVPCKTHEQKMLKIQSLIKEKIDQVLLFVQNILRDTDEDMTNKRNFNTLHSAMETMKLTASDDLAIFNMKAEQTYEQLFHDIARIEKETDRLMEGNRAIDFKYITEREKLIFLYMKKTEYIKKWEENRLWLHKYIATKACSDLTHYIESIHDKIFKDQEVTFETTEFLKYNIAELLVKLDEYPNKINEEHEKRTRMIAQLHEELGNMRIEKATLKNKLKMREREMTEWKIYREKKKIEDAELDRIAAREALARQQEEERKARKFAAENDYIATLTPKLKAQYLKDKQNRNIKAAKDAKKASKKATRNKRRKA